MARSEWLILEGCSDWCILITAHAASAICISNRRQLLANRQTSDVPRIPMNRVGTVCRHVTHRNVRFSRGIRRIFRKFGSTDELAADSNRSLIGFQYCSINSVITPNTHSTIFYHHLTWHHNITISVPPHLTIPTFRTPGWCQLFFTRLLYKDCYWSLTQLIVTFSLFFCSFIAPL